MRKYAVVFVDRREFEFKPFTLKIYAVNKKEAEKQARKEARETLCRFLYFQKI